MFMVLHVSLIKLIINQRLQYATQEQLEKLHGMGYMFRMKIYYHWHHEVAPCIQTKKKVLNGACYFMVPVTIYEKK